MNTVNVLPRLDSETGTIKVHLKRRLKYKNCTMSQNVRPVKVFEAAKWLTENSSLYKHENIKLNEQWIDTISTESLDNDCFIHIWSVFHEKQSAIDTVSYHASQYICLQNLEYHMFSAHQAEYENQSTGLPNKFNVVQQNKYVYGNNPIYFCSICSHWERAEYQLKEHMAVVHDLPPECKPQLKNQWLLCPLYLAVCRYLTINLLVNVIQIWLKCIEMVIFQAGYLI